MKKQIKKILSIVLVVSLLTSIGVFRNENIARAQEVAAPTIGNNKNLAETAAVNFPSTISKYQIPTGDVRVEGDTWYYSAIVNHSAKPGPWQCLEFAFAKATIDGNADQILRMSTRPGNPEKGYYFMWYAGPNIYDYSNGNNLTNGQSGIVLEANRDYRFTVKVKDRDKVSFWIDNKLILSEFSLSGSQKTVTNVEPVFGMRAGGTEGSIRDIKVWEVAAPEVITEINNMTLDNGQKVLFGNSLNSQGAEQYSIGGYTIGEKGKVYDLSGDFHFDSDKNYSGIGFSFGTLKDAEGTPHDLYITLQRTTYGKGMRWMLYADSRSDNDLIAYNDGTENFDAEKNYTLKIRCKEEKLSVSINDIEIFGKKISEIKKIKNPIAYTSFTVDKAAIIADMPATVSNIKVSGTELTERLIVNAMSNGTVEVSCDKADLSAGTRVVVNPKPAENCNVVAGSLKYTANEVSHNINNVDDQTKGYLFIMPAENTSLDCSFAENAAQSISAAVVGSSLEMIDEGMAQYDGIRFLIRTSLPNTTIEPKGQKVIYEGKEYTLTDYGTLSAKKAEYDVEGENALEKKSAEKIYSTTEHFVDYVVNFRELNSQDEAYLVMGYLELTPVGDGDPMIVKTAAYSESIASASNKL